MKYFLDTSVLLEDFEKYTTTLPIIISSQTLCELEEIKDNRDKSEDERSAAKKAIKWLVNHHDDYDAVITSDALNQMLDGHLDWHNQDAVRCAAAAFWTKIYDNEKLIFVTKNLNSLNIAEKIFGLTVEWFENKKIDNYTGFKEITMSDEDMAYFYENLSDNKYNLLVNEYLIIKNINGEIVDSYRWDGEIFLPTKIGNIKSDYFGTIKPYKGDVYQQCLLNSFLNNKITMVKGKAGTGKTICSLGYLMYLLEKRKIDKIILFTNTIPTINAARLGFYPGSRDEKLLESSVGNILASKFGDSFAVERLLAEGKLVLLPMCDIRGYDTTGMNAGILVTEAQNLNVELMKLLLQRIGQDSVCIIDGDCDAQVDNVAYGGKYNGMRRLSEVFRNHNFYGEIELQNIYRSKIAELAELL